MAFELVTPGEWKSPGGLPEGMCNLQKAGVLTMRTEDMAVVGIAADAQTCAVMVCQQTSRIAIRQSQEGDGASVFRMRAPSKKKGEKCTHLRQVNINVPLRKLGIKAEAYAGRYELHCKDNLLLLNLLDLSDEEKKLTKPHPDHARKLAATAAKK